MKIDIFPHILPSKYYEAYCRKAKDSSPLKESTFIHATLSDLDRRFRLMDKYEGLTQVLTVSAPPLESFFEPKDAIELAKLANDELAELVGKYPSRFTAAVACLPMNDIDAALKETDRAIRELKLKGVQIYTPINDKPLDRPEFLPLYEKMANYDLPIWIHPTRTRDFPDYRSEDHSKYWIFHTFGWPYETTAAMNRLAFSGVLEKYPNIKFITHHCGGMVPYFECRIIEGREMAKAFFKFNYNLSKPLIEYLRQFYNDTALNGSTPGLMCGYAFFGAGHLLFGTDMPFDRSDGEASISKTINSVEQMTISQREKDMIFSENAKRLLHLNT